MAESGQRSGRDSISVLAPDDVDRTRCVSGHGKRYRAEQEALDRAMAVASDHDQVGAPPLGFLDDRSLGFSLDDGRIDV